MYSVPETHGKKLAIKMKKLLFFEKKKQNKLAFYVAKETKFNSLAPNICLFLLFFECSLQ